MKVEFHRHSLSDEDRAEAMAVLQGLFLTTGEWTKRFEEKFASFLDVPYVVGLSSATNALELALRYHDIGEGDEVITTPMSFIATANAIEYCGAKAVFVDVEASTGNIDVSLIENAISPRTKAIMPVHLYGQMCDMAAISKIAQSRGLHVIEDSAHGFESSRVGIGIGRSPNIACFSFYATKNITCGEGGAVSCHDSDACDWFCKARMHGMSKNAADRYTKLYQHYDMEFLGYKCNMNNIAAALLIHQLDRAESFHRRRQAVAQRYTEAFRSLERITVPDVVCDSVHAHHLYTIWVAPEWRDDCLHALQERGIGVAVNYRSIHLMSYYRKKYGYSRGDFPVCERIGDSTISLPLYPAITNEEVEYVIDTVRNVAA